MERMAQVNDSNRILLEISDLMKIEHCSKEFFAKPIELSRRIAK